MNLDFPFFRFFRYYIYKTKKRKNEKQHVIASFNMMIISLYYSTDNDGRKNSFF